MSIKSTLVYTTDDTRKNQIGRTILRGNSSHDLLDYKPRWTSEDRQHAHKVAQIAKLQRDVILSTNKFQEDMKKNDNLLEWKRSSIKL